MAVYSLINSGSPIANGLACVGAPQNHATQAPVYMGTPELVGLGAEAALLATRYIRGGSTSWERPGSDLAS